MTESDIIKAEGSNCLHMVLFYQHIGAAAEEIRIMCKDDFESLKLQDILGLERSHVVSMWPEKDQFPAKLVYLSNCGKPSYHPFAHDGRDLLERMRLVYKKNKDGKLH